jgi:hypothetical protein
VARSSSTEGSIALVKGKKRKKGPMDYDSTAIATSYDAARGHRPEVLQQWLAIIAAHAPADSGLIVDVGCGTGRFSQPLSERLQAKVIGSCACAAAVAGIRRGLLNHHVRVHCDGGSLSIEWSGSGGVSLTGSITPVSGVLPDL